MIRTKITILLFWFFEASLLVGIEPTIDTIYKNPQFQSKGLGQWQWIPNSDDILIYQKLKEDSIKSFYKVNLEFGDTISFLPFDFLDSKIDSLPLSSFRFNQDGSKLLLMSGKNKIWRHSYSANYFILDLERESIRAINQHGSSLRNVKFSPDGNHLAYVKEDNNLYEFDLIRFREKQLTRSGSETILNGHFGWLYEEEFGGYDAYHWSPDSRFITFFQENQLKVKQFHWLNEREPYPELTSIYYPKVGEANPHIKMGVINIKNRRLMWLNEASDGYYPRAKWDNNNIIIFRLNRKQNQLDLLRFNIKSGKKEIILSERDSCWVDIHNNLRFLNNGFLWTSERSGFNHIYKYNMAGELIEQITDGNWEVRRIIKVDLEQKIIYFTATKNSEIENHLYSVSFHGGQIRLLTNESGWHSVNISPNNEKFIDSWSHSESPRTIDLKYINGILIRKLIEPNLTPYFEGKWTYPIFLKIKTSDGETLNGKLTLPWDFHPSGFYPILIHTYGLAGSQMVKNKWGGRSYLWHQLMAKNGFIIFSIDNRQTGGRGKAFKNKGYGDLGKWLINDHIEGIKYLGGLQYADTSRVGIWGWSGGGYATALALTKGAEFFDVGVAIASVTDWRLYDTAYTERYMGLISENESGYDSASVFSYVDKFKGKLLLIHGSGDDNVHAQHSNQLLDKFIAQGKFVDSMIYPSRNHGIYGGNATVHLREMMTNYFLTNLKN